MFRDISSLLAIEICEINLICMDNDKILAKIYEGYFSISRVRGVRG